jgi:hypothetical protein
MAYIVRVIDGALSVFDGFQTSHSTGQCGFIAASTDGQTIAAITQDQLFIYTDMSLSSSYCIFCKAKNVAVYSEQVVVTLDDGNTNVYDKNGQLIKFYLGSH